jgi:hypothetical protein
MSPWEISAGPEDARRDPHEDDHRWRWRLAQDERMVTVIVEMGAAFTADADMRAEVPGAADSWESSGRSAVEAVLGWIEPPARIEFRRRLFQPNFEGGFP